MRAVTDGCSLRIFCFHSQKMCVTEKQLIIIIMDSLLPLHLVLDIDHTLLHTIDINSRRTVNTAPDVVHKPYKMQMYYRPGLKEFLDWAFKHCLSVSLWTAGTSVYS